MSDPAEGQAFISSFTRKLGLAILLLVFGAGLASAQSPPQGPPAFVTLPRHAGIESTKADSSHPVPFRLELRNEMFEMVGTGAPGGGGGNGGGNNGGGGADFGQNAAVAMVPDCFPNSLTNFDATCAEASYQGEPMLAANNLFGRLIGASNDIYPGNCSAGAAAGSFGDCGLGLLVSTTGISWQRFKATRKWGGGSFLVGFDPSVAVDSAGRAFALYGVFNPSTGANGVVAVASADGGATWTKTNPVVLHGSGTTIFEDKYWIAADANPLSQFKDRLYVAWDRNQPSGSTVNQILLVSSSSDQGQTWTTPVKINDGTSDAERVIFAFPAVGPDGTVYVLWHDYGRKIIFIDKSSDGGITWGTDVAVASTNFTAGFGKGISCNGGRFVTPAPQMAIDQNGVIYITFTDESSGNRLTDVFIVTSTDGGVTWSRPKRVSSSSAGQQYLSAVGIDSLGRVGISYLDRRDDFYNCRTNTYLSLSTDGAATFTDFKVTDVDSDFDGNPNGPGDYQGIAAWLSSFYPFFSDHRDANATNDNTTGFIDGGFEIYAGRKP